MHACTLVFLGRSLAAPCKWRLLGWIDFYVQNLHLHAKSHSHWKGLCVPKHNQCESWAPTPCLAISPNCSLGVCNTYLGGCHDLRLFQKHVKNTFSTEIICKINFHKLNKPGFMGSDMTGAMGSMHEDTEVPLLNSREQWELSLCELQTVKCFNSACYRMICLFCPVNLSHH